MEQINATAACVLGLLTLGPTPGSERVPGPEAMTAWQISETAAHSLSRFWHVTRSQIYRELPHLAALGLVEESQAHGPRARRAYQTTEAGRAAFRSWLTSWAQAEPREEQLRSPLLLTVFFGESLPLETLRRVLEEYRPRYQQQLRQYQAMLAAIGDVDRPIPPIAVLRRGIAYRELMVQWIDDVLTDLDRT